MNCTKSVRIVGYKNGRMNYCTKQIHIANCWRFAGTWLLVWNEGIKMDM